MAIFATSCTRACLCDKCGRLLAPFAAAEGFSPRLIAAGQRGLAAVARAIDGRGPPTELIRALSSAAGCCPEELMR